MFILIRTDGWGPAYVRSGGTSSYTNRKHLATKYPTKEAAAADACGNEQVIPYEGNYYE